MSARAGRDLQLANVRLFPTPPDAIKDKDEACERFKRQDYCRRDSISRRINGTPLSCASVPNCVPCDVCAGSIGHPPLPLFPQTASVEATIPAQRLKIREERLGQLVQALYHIIDLLQLTCPYCALIQESSNHTLEECPHRLGAHIPVIRNVVSTFRKENYVPGLFICTYCHLPQSRHILGSMNRHIEHVKGDGLPCSLADRSIGLILSLLAAPLLHHSISTFISPTVDVIRGLFTLVRSSPCDYNIVSKQLYRIHFLMVAAYGRLPSMPSAVSEVVSAEWFKTYCIVENTRDTGLSILESLLPTLPEPTTTTAMEIDAPVIVTNINPEEDPTVLEQAFMHALQWIKARCPYCCFSRRPCAHRPSEEPSEWSLYREGFKEMMMVVIEAQKLHSICTKCYLVHSPPNPVYDSSQSCDTGDLLIESIIGIFAQPEFTKSVLGILDRMSYGTICKPLLATISPSARVRNLHMIFIAGVACLEEAPAALRELFQLPWFSRWKISDTQSKSSILDLLKPYLLSADDQRTGNPVRSLPIPVVDDRMDIEQ
jgi:hypothetical protein